jgi:hypothetical protein
LTPHFTEFRLFLTSITLLAFTEKARGIKVFKNIGSRGKMASASFRTCIHSGECRISETLFRWARQIFAGILDVFQKNLTQSGGTMTA